ncbi:MAG: beta-lactamase family protein [Ancrocorticia sp.]|nr:beta-lactamase family protein [Ancrocorticia sp.]
MPISQFLAADTFTFSHAYSVIHLDGPSFEAGELDRVYALASVTKTLAAWSALIAVEQKLIDLREPAGPEGSTFRHLLAHASGVPFDKGAVLTRPGQRRIYSNRGIEIMGEVLAAHTGTSIQEWITQRVLIPLGMTTTSVPGSPAYSGTSTIHDMEKFAAELLHPSLISNQMAAEASTVQFPGISGVLPGYGRQEHNDWGLGLEIRDHKNPHWTGSAFSPRTFGHFGQSGSFIWVDPTARKAGVFLGDKKFGDEHRAVWPELTNQMRAL